MLALASSGCYYGHLAEGQFRVLLARRSVSDLLADPDTPPELARQLRLADEARSFAARIGLEVAGQYTSYLPWPGDRIVTTVVATAPGEIDATPFRFPIVGQVPYKGFFDLRAAEAEAGRLRKRGFDVCLLAVPAYSTLGWMDDPLTQPMLQQGDGPLVETVVHELVHATVFVKSQPEFNEGVARFIGEEAAVRFYAADPEQLRRERSRVDDSRLLASQLLEFRREAAELYAEARGTPDLALRRAALEETWRTRLAALRLAGRPAADLATRIRLNDACLALRGTYSSDLPRHAAVLERLAGDLPAFVARLRSASESDDPRARFFETSTE